MVIRLIRFNIYLLLVPALLSGTGCRTPEQKQAKQTATLRIHIETNPLPDYSLPITVLSNAPMYLNIEKSPFLNEAHITSAHILERQDGFALQIRFNQQGQRLLEQYSSANTYRRFAIRSQFRQSTNVFDRWLAAPFISNRIADGLLNFTPDATRAEAECIVQGWNKVAGYKPKATEAESKFTEVP